MSCLRGVLLASVLIIAAAPAFAQSMGGPGGFGGGVPDLSKSGDGGDPSKNYQAGVEALQNNDFPLAESSFKKVLNVAPNDANTNFFYGYAKAAQNDFEGAEKAYRKALRREPDHVQALREHAFVALKLNQREAAEKNMARLRKLDAKCGGTCEEADQIKEAIPFVEQALASPAPAASSTPTP